MRFLFLAGAGTALVADALVQAGLVRFAILLAGEQAGILRNDD